MPSKASSRTKWCSTCSLHLGWFCAGRLSFPWDVLNVGSRVGGLRFSGGDRGGSVLKEY